MRKLLYYFLAFAMLPVVACNSGNKKKGPDVSGITVNVQLERFDKDFFAIDTQQVAAGLGRLQAKYPALTPIFLQNILGLDSASMLQGVAQFLQVSRPLYDTVNTVITSADDIRKEFEKAFRYVKYYFPDYKIPKLVTIVGPIDALAQGTYGPTPDFLAPDFMGISLQFYLGPDFSAYNDPLFIEGVVPAYRSRRFSREYIIADGMQLVTDDLFPDKSRGRPLIEQMIERGKQWWLLDKFLPGVPDSIKTGYTGAQVEWCQDNESMIWDYLLKNEDLHSINPATLQTYIGEGPFTQGMPAGSPGNIGAWIGWQIIKKFETANSGLSLADIMTTPATSILDGAKYRPR